MAAIETTPQAGAITLATGATETVVSHYGVSTGSHVSLTPTNADAGVEYRASDWWIECAKGTFTIKGHASSATVRTFSYSFVTPRK